MISARTFRRLVNGERTDAVALGFRLLARWAERPVRWFVARRNRGYDEGRSESYRMPVPVISVGNITTGGTGKTPLVAWIAEWFRRRGTAVTLISRGYGSRGGRPNDEAQELALRLPDVPHLQNPDRVAAARQALAANDRQVLLLDDAFQHRRIARDLDIVLLDALDPFGCEHLLPRGFLREPPENLARAQVVALSRADAVTPAVRAEIRRRVAELAPAADWVEVSHRPRQLLAFGGEATAIESLRGTKVLAFCGIGNPAGFRHTLESCGVKIIALRELPDHAAYPDAELSRLEAWIRQFNSATAVICTCKDLVKIPRRELAGLPLRGLGIEIQIDAGGEALERRLEAIRATCR